VGTLRRWLKDKIRKHLGSEAVTQWDVDSWCVCEGWPFQSSRTVVVVVCSY